jgi:hypothetical protein
VQLAAESVAVEALQGPWTVIRGRREFMGEQY